MKNLMEPAKELVETVRRLPALQALPGYQELEKKLIEAGTLEELDPTTLEDNSIVELATLTGPIFWIGIFSVPDSETGEIMEMPLVYNHAGQTPVISYTAELENIPSLITVCKTISKATGYPWRLIEYRAEQEYDKTMFLNPNSTTIH